MLIRVQIRVNPRLIQIDMIFRNLREIGTILASAFVNFIFYRKKPPLNPQFVSVAKAELRRKRRAVKKILIIKLDHIGDVLLATPVFHNLHEQYPEAEIDILVGSWSRPIIENIPYLNRIWEYDSSFFCRSSNEPAAHSTPDLIELVNQIRKRKYDLVVELRGDLLTAVIAPFSFSRYRIARATLQIKDKIDKIFRYNSSRSKHEVDRNLHLLEHYGIEVKTRQIFFDIPEEKKSWARCFLDGTIDNSKDLVAIHPGSPAALKRWSFDNFSELADNLIKGKSVQIIFVGTEDEKPIIDEIQSKMRYDSINLAGQTDLQELGAILQNCVLFIGNDSAPMHIASAVGIHTIGLFGPSSPERFGAYGEHCYALRKTNCPPCMAEKCKIGIKCIDEISVKDVLELIDTIFSISNQEDVAVF